MKPNRSHLRSFAAYGFGLCAGGMVGSAPASTWTGPLGGASYTWNTSGANWDSTPNFPAGADSSAVFNGNFTGTVTMTGDNTLGSISYTDTGSSNNGLQLASGTLTFDTTTGTPSISYVNGTGNGLLWIGQAASFAIAGNDGLTIDAGNAGQAVRLGNASGSVGINWSAFTGALTLSRGSFQPQVANVLPQAAGSRLVLGSGSNTATLSLFGNSRNQSVVGLDGNAQSSVNNGSNGTTATLTLGINSTSAESFNFNGQIGSVAAGNDNISVIKTGAGTQTLSGNSLYTGTTTVSGGTLKLGHANALGTTAGISSVAAGAVLDLNGQTIAEQFGDTGSTDGFTGTGIGGTGALINSSATAATITGDIYGNSANGIASGKNGFVVGGSGDIALLGKIDRRNSGVAGMGIQKIGNGTLTIGGTVSNGAFNDLWVDGGTAVLAKSGNAVAVLNVTINGGTLKMDPNNVSTNANAWQGQIGNGLTFGENGGTWDLNGTGGVNNRLKGVNGSTGTITNNGTAAALLNFGMRDNNASWSYSGTIADGTGTVAITTTNGGFGSGQVQTLGGNNSYSGGSTLTYGTLRMGHDNALGTGWVKNSATLDLNGRTLGNELRDNGNGAVFTNSSATAATVSQGFNTAHAGSVVVSDFTVGGTAGNIDWSGDVYRTNGVGLITKNGTNTVTFGGDVNGMGLAVTGGTAAISGNFGGGNITVSSGAVMNVTSGAVMDGIGLTSVSGALSLLAGGTWRFDIGANGINDAIQATGTISLDGLFAFDLGMAELLDGNSWQIVDAANVQDSFGAGFSVSGFLGQGNLWTFEDGDHHWSFDESDGRLSLAVVPEPGAALLGGLGLLALLRRRR